MENNLLLAKIAASKREVLEAERCLRAALRGTRHAPRAQKTTVTAVVREALMGLRTARAHLEALGRLVPASES